MRFRRKKVKKFFGLCEIGWCFKPIEYTIRVNNKEVGCLCQKCTEEVSKAFNVTIKED